MLFRIMMTVANTDIKNTMRYFGDSVHAGAHIPVNSILIEDITKEPDARDVKYAIDQWMSYKPLGKNGNWAVSQFLLKWNYYTFFRIK